jgi:hypothetical protein
MTGATAVAAVTMAKEENGWREKMPLLGLATAKSRYQGSNPLASNSRP